MQQVTLENIPQQTFSISLGDHQWTLSFRTANNATSNCTLADIKKDGQTVISGVLCAPNSPLLPYPYMQSGNFVFISTDDSYPNYENFGITNTLYYIEEQDIEELNA